MRRLLTALAATVALLGVGAAPASAHLPDYNKAYAVSYNDAYKTGKAATGGGFTFYGVTFAGSGVSGDHSREFSWTLRYRANASGYFVTCWLVEYVGHTYSVFNRWYNGCS